MVEKYTRREVNKGIGAAVTLQAGGDDGGLLDGWLDDWFDSEPAPDEKKIAVGTRAERKETDSRDDIALFIETPAKSEDRTGVRVYEPGEMDTWDPVPHIGPNPAIDSIDHRPSEQTVVDEKGRVRGDVKNERTESEVVNADETLTETLGYDYSESNPQWPRMPEGSGGPVWVRPYPGVEQPILDGSDVGITTNAGVADPFIRWFPELGQYAIIAEIYPENENQDIGYWTSPTPTVPSTWTWGDRLSLTDLKTAFPYTIKHQGQWYMFPGMSPGEGVHVYTLDAGEPSTTADLANWSFHSNPLPNVNAKDPIVFPFNDYWWLICNDTDVGETNVFYGDTFADVLNDNLSAHPSNPVMAGRAGGGGRVPGGTPIVHENCVDFIDHTINIHRITELTPTAFSYTEGVSHELAVFTSNGDWNDSNMHHMDVCVAGPASQPLVVADGTNNSSVITTGLYTLTDQEPSSATMYASTDHTATSSAYTQVQLDSLDHDVRAVCSTTNYEYVVPTTGYYQLSGAITLNNISATDFTALGQIIVGGEGPQVRNEAHAVVDGENLFIPLTPKTVYIPAGSTIYMNIYNRSASNETIKSGTGQTFMSVRKVAE